jgi:hypothetical protein
VDLGDAIAMYVADLLTLIADTSETTIGEILAVRSDGANALSQFESDLTSMFQAAGWAPPNSDGTVDGIVPVDSVHEERAMLRARSRVARETSRDVRTTSQQLQQHLEAAREEVEHLRIAMRSRAVIEQAKGIVMGQYGLTADAAWNYLVRESQSRNVKLRQLAENIVGSVTGDRPNESRRRTADAD